MPRGFTGTTGSPPIDITRTGIQPALQRAPYCCRCCALGNGNPRGRWQQQFSSHRWLVCIGVKDACSRPSLCIASTYHTTAAVHGIATRYIAVLLLTDLSYGTCTCHVNNEHGSVGGDFSRFFSYRSYSRILVTGTYIVLDSRARRRWAPRLSSSKAIDELLSPAPRCLRLHDTKL